jgi:hypothetical protein
MPLIIVEGELDCLLMAQELGELAAVVTLGSASARPEGDILRLMLAAPTWFIATDADEAGDKAASGWPARAQRVRPPVVIMPGTGRDTKDWGDHHSNGLNLRRWWSDRLGGIEAPELSTWEELAMQRPTPGIVVEAPAPWVVNSGGVVYRPETAGPSGTAAIEPEAAESNTVLSSL